MGAAARAQKAPAGAPVDVLERWEVAKLKPFAQNARTHSPEQIDQLVASIEEFGFTIPVLVDEKGMIIAGHGRVLAAAKREMSHVPVLVARGWSDARKRAYVIADNKLAEGAGWDRNILGSELGNLSLGGFNVDVLGFAPGEIKALIAQATKGNADPDDAPPAPASPVSQPGDLWVLGEHRVLCGDACSRAAVDRLLAGRKPHLMVTDPPYGVDYDPDWRTTARNANGKLLSTGKGRAKGKVANDQRADWREAWHLFPGVVAYVWHSGKHGTQLGVSLEAAKFALRSQIVWVKSNFVVGRGDYHWGHEAAFYTTKQGTFEDHWRFEDEHEVAAYAVKLGATAEWRGGRKQSTVWQIDMVKNDTGHGTQKPVECMRRPIANNSKGGDLIYDPFLGSGTTVIAAHIEGRVCLGLEIDAGYVDVIVERWATFTGLTPVHEATGKTFSEMKALRDGKQKGTGESGRGRARAEGGRDRGRART